MCLASVMGWQGFMEMVVVVVTDDGREEMNRQNGMRRA